MFRPSEHSDLGGDNAESTDYEAMLKEYAPVLRTGVEQLVDPTKQEGVYTARIANLKEVRARSPDFLKPAITRRIRIMEAKLRAAKRRVGLQRETESAQRTYRALTQSVIAGGVVITVALAALIWKRTR